MANNLNICNQSCNSGCFSEVYVNNPLCQESKYYYMNRNKNIETYVITNQYLHLLDPSEEMRYGNFKFKLQLVKKDYFVNDGLVPPNEGNISEHFFLVYLKKHERNNSQINPIVTKGLNQTFTLLSKCGLIKQFDSKCHKSNNLQDYTHYIPFKMGTRQKLKDMKSFQEIKDEALPYIKKALWATIMITTVINLSKNMIITQFKKAGIVKEDKIQMFENILSKYITFINKHISILLQIVVTEFEKNNGLIEKCNNYFYNIISNPFAHQDISYKGAGGTQKTHKFVIFSKLFENLSKNKVIHLNNSNSPITRSRSNSTNSTNTVVPTFNSTNMFEMNNNGSFVEYDNEISIYRNSLDLIATELYKQITSNPQFSSTIKSMIMMNLESNMNGNSTIYERNQMNKKSTIYERSQNNKSIILKESINPLLNFYTSMINGFKLNNSNNHYVKSLIFEKIKNNIIEKYNDYNLLSDTYDENIMILRILFPEINNMITQRKRNLNNAKSTPISTSIFSRFTSLTSKQSKSNFYVKINIKNQQIYVLYNTIGRNQKNVVHEQLLNIPIIQRITSNSFHEKIHHFVLNNVVLANSTTNSELYNDFVNKYNQEIDKINENIQDIIMYKYGTDFESLNISNIKNKNINVNSLLKTKNNSIGLLKMLKKRRNNSKRKNSQTNHNQSSQQVQHVKQEQPSSVFRGLRNKFSSFW